MSLHYSSSTIVRYLFTKLDEITKPNESMMIPNLNNIEPAGQARCGLRAGAHLSTARMSRDSELMRWKVPPTMHLARSDPANLLLASVVRVRFETVNHDGGFTSLYT